jgi:hypothetical protein
MPGLDPGIHDFAEKRQNVDGSDKRCHGAVIQQPLNAIESD